VSLRLPLTTPRTAVLAPSSTFVCLTTFVILTLDSYVVDVLMRDLTEHEKRPSAFLVYLHIWRRSLGADQRAVASSYQDLAEGTGLSKPATQGAVRLLERRTCRRLR
jgi:hypothetical protein